MEPCIPASCAHCGLPGKGKQDESEVGARITPQPQSNEHKELLRHDILGAYNVDAAGPDGPGKQLFLEANYARPSLGLIRELQPVWDPEESDVRNTEISIASVITFPLDARRYLPGKDATSKWWVDIETGEQKKIELNPYALADKQKTECFLRGFIKNESLSMNFTKLFDCPIIVDLYRFTYTYYTLKGQTPQLERLLQLCFATVMTTGSAHISGRDKLDMEPFEDPSYPLRGKVAVPRRIVDEVGHILCSIITELQKPALQDLAQLFKSCGPKDFLSLFLMLFIHLHLVEHISEDRRRHAIENNNTDRYTLPEYVQGLKNNAKMMVKLWGEFINVLGIDSLSEKSLRQIGLDEAQICFVKRCNSTCDKGLEVSDDSKYKERHVFTLQMFAKCLHA